MKITLKYFGKSKGGKSDIYKHEQYGSATVIVYVPPSGTTRPDLEFDLPDWWIDNTGPRS